MKINLETKNKYNLDEVRSGDILIVDGAVNVFTMLYKEDAEEDLFFIICLNGNNFVKSYRADVRTLEDVFEEWHWKLVEIIPSEELEIRRINK